jgi:MFS family permease
MKISHRRYWVFFLLFLFNAIAYVGLSPIALGYLFSSFLWAYVLMMLPGGRLIDRWGTHIIASIATAVWSAAQMATGIVGSFATMLVARLGRDVGEAPLAPVTYSSFRSWSPYTERGTAIAAILCRIEPRAGSRRARRGLADRDIVVAADTLAAAGGARAHLGRA